ncbi:MAG: hypothetical protein R3200_05750 [Xanthomonadales bacterium]|nr:hypothetical protein [Xanthomonadales bacterium]
MTLFLQIVLAVVIVLALALAGTLWFAKRWLRRVAGDYAAATELVDQRWLRPARILLQRASEIESEGDLDQRWQSLAKLGFRRLADFDDAHFTVRAGWHEDYRIAAALMAECSGESSIALFSIDEDDKLTAVSNDSATDIQTARLLWTGDPSMTTEAALEHLREQIGSSPLRKLDVRLFRTAWEEAYAARMDQLLSHKPPREMIERRAREQEPAPSEEQIEHAHEMLVQHWKAELETAVLDHFRRSSQIDAVTWERLEDVVQVVHGHLDSDDVEGLLVEDEAGEAVFAQCSAQGYSGIDLYEQVMQRLPAAPRRERLAEVQHPLRAVLYVPTDEPDPEAGQYVYEATDPDGRTVRGAVTATSAGDAKGQLEKLGLERSVLLLEPTPGSGSDHLLDPETAALAAKVSRESMARSLVRALLSNWWIWAPPALLLGWTIREGLPLGWADYLVILYAIGALLALIFLVAPMVLYNELLRARTSGRLRTAGGCLRLLRALDRFGNLPESALLMDEAKILAAGGEVEGAVELWQRNRADLDDVEYLTGLAQIHDAAGDHEMLIKTQRAALAAAPGNETFALDLAISLSRFGPAYDEAEELIQPINPGDLSELALAGYQFVRGLIASGRELDEQALAHFSRAIEQVEQFRGNPLVLSFISEINAFAAISLKRMGDTQRAEALWKEVWPMLKVHRGSERLESRYAGA